MAKKSYTQGYMEPYFDGTYYGYPTNIKISDKQVNAIFEGMMSGKKSFSLNDELVNNNGVNAAFVIGEGRNTNTIPTYKQGALLPEITVTPKETYFDDPVNKLKYRRSLENAGR